MKIKLMPFYDSGSLNNELWFLLKLATTTLQHCSSEGDPWSANNF
jgi:hypothetical protein